jgi:hypothetical protein
MGKGTSNSDSRKITFGTKKKGKALKNKNKSFDMKKYRGQGR